MMKNIKDNLQINNKNNINDNKNEKTGWSSIWIILVDGGWE